MRFEFRQQVFHLSAEKAMYWENTNALLLADMHLSKETHFRKHGIAVPDGITRSDFARLTKLVAQYNPSRIIVIGDLFHSEENASLALFGHWKRDWPQIAFQLVSGNHDIMEVQSYAALQIELLGDTYVQNKIVLTHHPETVPTGNYGICGHLHPAVHLSGKAKQSLRLPCYWFGKHYAVLPAFGGFTGMKTIRAASTDAVFAIAGDQVIRVK